MIKIDKSYGSISITNPDGSGAIFTNMDEFLAHCYNIVDGLEQETVEAVTYAASLGDINAVMDLMEVAYVLTTGKGMYEGDCIKLTIKAEYCPENK